MRYELTDNEWFAIEQMLPNKPHESASWLIGAASLDPEMVLAETPHEYGAISNEIPRAHGRYVLGL